MTQSTFSLGEPHANRSALQDFAKDLMTHEATSCSPILPLLNAISPDGWFGRTSPAYCHPTEDGILEPSSRRWGKSGMGSPTECWTLNTSESPKGGVVSLLSDALVGTGEAPAQFFLTPLLCVGLIRRADRRGLEIDPQLREALMNRAVLHPNWETEILPSFRPKGWKAGYATRHGEEE